MINFNELIANESVEDVIVFFAGSSKSIGYPEVDRFFSRYKPVVHQTGEFMNTFHALSSRGIVSMNEKMGLIKGPNWKAPAFMEQKKYGIE
jgi:hypothetical protein